MQYGIEITSHAKKQLAKLSSEIQQRIAKKITGLSQNPRPIGTKKLSGEDHTYRIREGDYRILYAIQDTHLLILVVKIGHRRDVYQ